MVKKKPEKYVPSPELQRPKQPKGKSPQKPQYGTALPYRVASVTGQSVGADVQGWLSAGAGGGELGAGGQSRGNPLGARQFQGGSVGIAPAPTGFIPPINHYQLSDSFHNDPLPSTAIRKPFLFYRYSTPTPLGASVIAWAMEGGEPALILQRVAFTVPGVVVHGIGTVANGKHFIFVNVGSETMTFAHESATATNADYRLISPTGANISFPPNAYIEAVRDEVTHRWRFGPLGAPGAGGTQTKESHVTLLATEPETVCA